VVFGTAAESIAIERQVKSLVHFLAPVFFVHVGLLIDVHALSAGLGLALVMTGVAAASKVVGCGGLALTRRLPGREALLIGIGMIPRGEVGLIIAGIGARIGLFDDRLFSAATLMCVLTIVIVPPMLKPLARGSVELPTEGVPDEDSA
jgi:Kef-type K+ transport system membrane component KefB